MRYPIRIIATENGNKRQLVKITCNATGGLTFAQTTGMMFKGNEEVGSLPEQSEKIEGDYFSFHETVESETINTVKRTIITENGRRPASFHHTSAIKVHNRFAFVYFRRLSSQNDNYVPFRKTGGTIFDLGPYDPNYWTLFFAVYVGPLNVDLPLEKKGLYLNVMHFDTNIYRISIIWSFLSVVTYPFGLITDLQTSGNEETKSLGLDISNPGLEPTQCFDFFRHYRTQICADLFKLMSKDVNFRDMNINEIAELSVFYRYGRGERDFVYALGQHYRKDENNSPYLYLLKHAREPTDE